VSSAGTAGDVVTGRTAADPAQEARLRAAALSGLPAPEVLSSAEWAPLLDALAREAAARAPDGTAPAPEATGQAAGPVTAALAAMEDAVRSGRRPRGPGTLAVLAACERAERLGRPLNAVVTLIGAPRRAPGGPLAGQPVAVKDIITVRGAPARCGSPVSDPAPAATDATVVQRLRDAGAEVFATTQCLEYAAGFAHPAIGGTRNPRDVSRTSGGSSGGSAAVVAARVCEAALGTDTGGSIRIPAAYCGVVGLKPTLGLLPSGGVFPLSPTCDHVGTLTATAAGAASLLPVLAGGLARGPAGAGGPVAAGVLTAQLSDPSVTPEVGNAVDRALAVLAAGGWAVREVTAPWLAELPAWEEALAVIVSREAWQVHRSRDTGGYAEGTRALLEFGASVSDERYRRALEQRARLTAAVDASLAGVDVLAGPTVGYQAPEQDPPFGVGEDQGECRFTGPYNLTGHPALSMPVPIAGLPAGLQLAARRDRDLALLRAAAEAERLLARAPAGGGPAASVIPEE
jgi:Asp-tRNA(Asn)/Glu-tRNA(Gln) amidotransferase A subunit family amidase